MKAQQMAFERRYSDDSGVEYGVYYNARDETVTLEHIDSIKIPVSEINWFIDALREVQYEPPDKPKSPIVVATDSTAQAE